MPDKWNLRNTGKRIVPNCFVFKILSFEFVIAIIIRVQMLLKSLSSYSKFTITDQTVSIPMKFMVQLARNRNVRVCFIDVKYGSVPYTTIRVTVTFSLSLFML